MVTQDPPPQRLGTYLRDAEAVGIIGINDGPRYYVLPDNYAILSQVVGWYEGLLAEISGTWPRHRGKCRKAR
jgi:hypothetical protein